MFHEGLGAGTRNGAKVTGEVIGIHTNAIIADGKRAQSFVRYQMNGVFRCAQFRLGYRQITQLITRISRIRNQLAKENFLLAVERMHNDIKQTAYFRLKGLGL